MSQPVAAFFPAAYPIKDCTTRSRLIVTDGPKLLWCARAIGLTHFIADAGPGWWEIRNYRKRKTRILVRFKLIGPHDREAPKPHNALRSNFGGSAVCQLDLPF